MLAAILVAVVIPACGGGGGAQKRTVLFFGDSITREAIKPENGLGTAYNASNWGVGGLGIYFAYRMTHNVLRDNPGATLVAIAFGTNDAYNSRLSVADFEAHLNLTVDLVIADGRIPMLPTIPYSPLIELANTPAYNKAIARVVAAKGCVAGPDFYAHFLAHPEQLQGDQTHPTQTGLIAMNQMWAAVIAGVH